LATCAYARPPSYPFLIASHNKKLNIESDVMGMIREHPRADKYFFTIYRETADFTLNLLRKRGVAGQIVIVNLATE